MLEREYLQGAAELDQVLAGLPHEIAKTVAEKAVLAAARVVAADMQSRTPIGAVKHFYKHRKKGKFTGDLSIRKPGFARAHIKARLLYGRNLALAQEVFPGGAFPVAAAGATKEAFYLRFIEYGWNLTRGRRGAKGRKILKHIPAHPFLRPAWEGSKHAALDAMGKVLAAGVEKAAERLATRSYAQSGFSVRGRSLLRALR